MSYSFKLRLFKVRIIHCFHSFLHAAIITRAKAEVLHLNHFARLARLLHASVVYRRTRRTG